MNLLHAQTINGKITDTEGNPLPGATVLNTSSSEGIVSDFDGNFSINASLDDELEISFIGYLTLKVTVSDTDQEFNFMLESDVLDEVVVTSLGISRAKKSLGYAVTEVEGDAINTVKDHNIASSLQGKVAGLNITTSGSMGSGSRITIRGNNSIGGNNQALIVVDGVPINADGINSGGSVYNSVVPAAGITDINPNDVESISVLKGPNAAALYGARAGNGVILITTKSGKVATK